MGQPPRRVCGKISQPGTTWHLAQRGIALQLCATSYHDVLSCGMHRRLSEDADSDCPKLHTPLNLLRKRDGVEALTADGI